MGYYCTVPQCTSLAGKTKWVKFHRFPRDEKLAKEWNLILKRNKPYTKFSKVCSLHFKPSDYKKEGVEGGTLRNGVVPTQNLPVTSSDGKLLVFRKPRTSRHKLLHDEASSSSLLSILKLNEKPRNVSQAQSQISKDGKDQHEGHKVTEESLTVSFLKKLKLLKKQPKVRQQIAKETGNPDNPTAEKLVKKKKKKDASTLRMIRKQDMSVRVKQELAKTTDVEPSMQEEEIQVDLDSPEHIEPSLQEQQTQVDLYTPEHILGIQPDIYPIQQELENEADACPSQQDLEIEDVCPSRQELETQAFVYPTHQELETQAFVYSSHRESQTELFQKCSMEQELDAHAVFNPLSVKDELDIGPEELQVPGINYVSPQFTNELITQPESEDDTTCISGGSRQKVASKRRVFDESYTKYGFTFLVDEDGMELPKCTICSKVFSNEALRPYRLKRHQQVHEARMNTMKVDTPGCDTKLLRASYEIALLIAKQMKHPSIGQDLIKSCITTAAKIVVSDSYSERLNRLKLSEVEMEVLIDDMAKDINYQVLLKVNSSPCFAILCDESTDVGDCAQLMVYVRYISLETIKFEEDILYSQLLSATTTAEDIFDSVSNYIDENLNWERLMAVCTEGAGMLGPQSNFVKGFKTRKPSIMCTHCVTHVYALASITMPQSLLDDLKIVIDIVNYIKKNSFNSQLFVTICEGLDESHKTLLLHTEFRWLSKGNILARIHELKNEVSEFLKAQNKNELVIIFENENFEVSLAYLADVFEDLSALSLQLQSESNTILYNYDCFQTVIDKLVLWIDQVSTGNITMFPRLNEALQNRTISFDLQDKIKSHLQSLKEEFYQYFLDIDEDSPDWLYTRDPFTFSEFPDKSNVNFLNFELYPKAQYEIDELGLESFWLKYFTVEPVKTEAAICTLIPFSSTGLCEAGFSALLTIKTQYPERYNVENDLRLTLSVTQPRLDDIVASKITVP